MSVDGLFEHLEGPQIEAYRSQAGIHQAALSSELELAEVMWAWLSGSWDRDVRFELRLCVVWRRYGFGIRLSWVQPFGQGGWYVILLQDGQGCCESVAWDPFLREDFVSEKEEMLV